MTSKPCSTDSQPPLKRPKSSELDLFQFEGNLELEQSDRVLISFRHFGGKGHSLPLIFWRASLRAYAPWLKPGRERRINRRMNGFSFFQWPR